MSTDDEWEKWGKIDPYFAVLTDEKFRRDKLTDVAKREFFESGQAYVKRILATCRHKLDEKIVCGRALDFGCGTGRVLIPLAESMDTVVGIDVSDSMLSESAANCAEAYLDNVELLKSDDELSRLEGSFDFVHSVIVFQHIPVVRGMKLLSKLFSHLNDGGVAVIQLTYSKALGSRPIQESQAGLRRVIRLLYGMLRRGKSSGDSSVLRDPEMQMNQYDLNEVFFLIQSLGIKDMHLEFTDHGGEMGVFLFFQKRKS